MGYPGMHAGAPRPTMGAMPKFAAERYLPGSTPIDRADEVARVRAAREHMAVLGVVHVRSLIVPADEMCMHLFDAAREADLIVAYRRARLPYDRIVEVELAE